MVRAGERGDMFLVGRFEVFRPYFTLPDRSKMKQIFALAFLTCTPFLGMTQTVDTLDYSAYPRMAQIEIAQIQAPFQDALNPMVVTYLGSQMNDYAYFPFQAENGQVYDFAYRDNNLGDLPFGENDGLEPRDTGQHLVGKRFTLEWEYERSYIVCCEGQNNTYPAMLPRIKEIRPQAER